MSKSPYSGCSCSENASDAVKEEGEGEVVVVLMAGDSYAHALMTLYTASSRVLTVTYM